MRTRRVIPTLIVATLALAACTAQPVPTGTPTPDPTADPVEAASILVTSAQISVVGTDGSPLVTVDYGMDAASAATELATALGADPIPTMTPPATEVEGCQTEQTTYDFGGLVLRSPGFVGTAGEYEALVLATATSDGVAIETVGGVAVGDDRATFEATITDEVVLGDNPPTAHFGFDLLAPGTSEFGEVGTLARFEDDVLVHLNTPFLLQSDC